MILNEAALQYWHNKFNQMFFNNELEPAIIKIFPHDEFNDYGIEANFISVTDPFLIQFHYDVSESDNIYTLTVLLHEMVHQHCLENNIEDMDEEDKHTKDFIFEGENHGLSQGYFLQTQAEERIKEELKKYDSISSVGEVFT